MYASGHGFFSRVKRLLARGARVNVSTTADGPTALLLASLNGHLEVVLELCKMGANVRAAESTKALIAACLGCHLEIVREMCAQGANVNDVAPFFRGCTALIMASQEGHLEVVRELYKRVRTSQLALLLVTLPST